MLIDLKNLFWTDSNEEYGLRSSLMMGFSIIVNIFDTKYSIENKLISTRDPLDEDIKLTAVFNGQGNTFKEMEIAFNSDFNEVPFPDLFPVIGQSNSISNLKSLCIKYVNMQYGAYKESRPDITRRLEEQDEVMKFLIEKYMNMFSIKNEAN